MAKSKAKAEADARYDKKAYDRIELKIRKDTEINREFIRAHAEARGESLNGFFLRAAIETIQRDNAGVPADKATNFSE